MKTLITYLVAVASWLLVLLVFSPVFLIFSTGSEGEPTIWNVVGIAYLIILVWFIRKKLL